MPSEENSKDASPPPVAPTPSVPDLGSTSSFKPSSFSRESGGNPASEAAFEITRDPLQAATNNAGQTRLLRYPLDGPIVGHPAGAVFDSAASSDQTFETVDSWYEPSGRPGSRSGECPLDSNESLQPGYRPDLGHRGAAPTYRAVVADDHDQAFGFENKITEYPSMREILATGRYFGSASALYFRAAFQGNTAIATQGPGFGQSIPFDFDYESAPQFRMGFESKYGPGVEITYWQYDETSNVTSFVSDGTVIGTSSTWMLGPSRWSRLAAVNTGEQLDASHSIDVEVIGATFFKEMKFRISRLNGLFGFQYSSTTQSMDVMLSNSGTEIGRLASRSDLHAWGPKFGLEYYRPIGHTKLELLTTVGGSVLFGHRDQFVSNTSTGDFDRVDADEFVTMVDFLTGIQYKKMTAENRAYYARLGVNYQTWIGGGTAVDPQGDFGLRGFSFGVGYNR